MTALALRQSGAFSAVDVYEQTKTPSTAGAGLNIPPNGARLCRWLGVDLDGGDPKGPDGAIDGGRAAILTSSRQFNEDGTMSERPFDHNTAADDNAGALDVAAAVRSLEFHGHFRPIRNGLGSLEFDAVFADPESVGRESEKSLLSVGGRIREHTAGVEFGRAHNRSGEPSRGGATVNEPKRLFTIR